MSGLSEPKAMYLEVKFDLFLKLNQRKSKKAALVDPNIKAQSECSHTTRTLLYPQIKYVQFLLTSQEKKKEQ